MDGSSKNIDQAAGASDTLAPLVADLNCNDSMKCLNARLALVERGPEAVPYLVEALKTGKDFVPLEAAKALGNIGGPQATWALIDALEDARFDVRWVAAEELVRIGPDAIKPLLKALIEKADSLFLRQGAHHVFSDTEDPQKRLLLGPVLAAIDDDVPRLEVPVVAKKALDKLESKR